MEPMATLDLSDHPDHTRLDTWVGEFSGSPRYGELEAFAYNKDGVTRAWAIKSAKRELARRGTLRYEWIPVEQLAERIGDMDVSWDRAAEDARWDPLDQYEIEVLEWASVGSISYDDIENLGDEDKDALAAALARMVDREFLEKDSPAATDYELTEDGQSVVEHQLYDGSEAIIDLSVPVIAAQTPEWGLLPIDGWHRIAKAQYKEIEKLPVFVLTQDEDLRVQGLKARLLR